MIGDALKGPLGSGEYGGPLAMLWSSAFFSGLTDNIPLSAVLAKVLANPELVYEYKSLLWWSLIFGAGLGGNFTPIGSASTVVALTILKKEGHKMSFVEYTKLGAIVVVVQLILATVYLLAIYQLGFLS